MSANLILPTSSAEGVGDEGGGGGSVPTKSLRFDDGSSPELSRTYTSSATWTFACWVKRGELGATNYLLGSVIGFNASDQLFAPGITNTTELFRDPTAWLHICCSDSGLYVNGVQLSGTVSTSALTDAKIGDDFDGYLHDIYFVDGTALAPVGNFIEVDSTSGVIKPAVYDLSGDGSKSFHLDFEDDSDIGNDVGGNDQDFTATNLSSHDCVPDIPTNNFATFCPIIPYVSGLSEGNLKVDWASKHSSDFGMSSGKWYWEARYNGGAHNAIGITPQRNLQTSYSGYLGLSDDFAYTSTGKLYGTNQFASIGTTAWSSGDIIGLALDHDAATFKLYINGTLEYTESSLIDNSHTFFPSVAEYGSGNTTFTMNFGQDSTFAGEETAGGESDDNGYGDFAYPVPTGYLALCSANLTATIADPSKHFGAITWTGNGVNADDAQAITGLGFQPDLLWIKGRSGEQHHEMHDSVRGADKRLFNATSGAESDVDTMSSFDSDGFTVKMGPGSQNGTNGDGLDYIGWCWKAGTAFDPSTGGGGTGGSKNASAGFSIVTWSGQDDDMESGSDTDVYHGLGVKPDLILIKNRTNNADGDASSDTDWCMWNSGLSGDDYFMRLNTSDDEQQWDSGYEGLKSIGTSTFTAANGQYDTGTYFFQNWEDMAAMSSGEADDYVAYCFANSDVFKTGTYLGNSLADGPVIHTGFKPAMVWLDRIGSQSMHIMDTARSPSNVVDEQLYPNSNGAEAADNLVKIDILSNGFKLRNSQTATNTTGYTYLYYAFAEEHAKHSTAF